MKKQLLIACMLLATVSFAQTDKTLTEQLNYLTSAPNGWVMSNYIVVDDETAQDDIGKLSTCVRSYVIRFNKNGTYTEIPTKTNCPDQIIEKETGKWSYKSCLEGHGMAYLEMKDAKIAHYIRQYYVIRISTGGMVLAEQGGTNWPNNIIVYRQNKVAQK